MGYREALEAAGAEVHAYGEFGSYQGDWLAKVTYQGKTGWIHDYFGSCSGCDAFEGEIGWQVDAEGYEDKLKAFGENYLDNIISYDDIIETVSQNLSWDCDAQKMVDFVKDNA